MLTTSDYRLEFDGTSYKARRLSDNEILTINENPPGTLSFTDRKGRDRDLRRLVGVAARRGFPQGLCISIAKEVVARRYEEL